MTPATLFSVNKLLDAEPQDYEEIGTQVLDSYFSVSTEVVVAIPLREATDEELMYLVAKTGAFSFWDKTEEDIYTLEDGSPVQ